jgi:hypothetical protein
MNPPLTQYERRLHHWVVDGDWQEKQDTETPLGRFYEILPVTKAAGDAFILKYEHLQSIGHPRARYGAIDRLNGRLVALATFGSPAHTPKYPNTIVLERGACHPLAHKDTASWFIPKAIKRASQDHGWKIFEAFTDEAAGERGVIYRACNFIYVGQSRGGRAREKWCKGDVELDEKSAKHRGRRQIGRDFTNAELESLGWQRVFKEASHKWVTVEAPTFKECKALRALFEAPNPP